MLTSDLICGLYFTALARSHVERTYLSASWLGILLILNRLLFHEH